jgi:hypothetical protein
VGNCCVVLRVIAETEGTDRDLRLRSCVIAKVRSNKYSGISFQNEAEKSLRCSAPRNGTRHFLLQLFFLDEVMEFNLLFLRMICFQVKTAVPESSTRVPQ